MRGTGAEPSSPSAVASSSRGPKGGNLASLPLALRPAIGSLRVAPAGSRGCDEDGRVGHPAGTSKLSFTSCHLPTLSLNALSFAEQRKSGAAVDRLPKACAEKRTLKHCTARAQTVSAQSRTQHPCALSAASTYLSAALQCCLMAQLQQQLDWRNLHCPGPGCVAVVVVRLVRGTPYDGWWIPGSNCPLRIQIKSRLLLPPLPTDRADRGLVGAEVIESFGSVPDLRGYRARSRIMRVLRNVAALVTGSRIVNEVFVLQSAPPCLRQSGIR